MKKAVLTCLTLLSLIGCGPASEYHLARVARATELPEVKVPASFSSTSLQLALEGLEDNGVVSPAGLGLAFGGLGLASNSDNGLLDKLGITEDNYLPLLGSLNFDYQKEVAYPDQAPADSSLSTFAFLQAIGDKIEVDEKAAKELASLGLSNIASSFDTYRDVPLFAGKITSL